MDINKLGSEGFLGEDDETGEDEDDVDGAGRPKIIHPQTFPTTPIPIPRGNKSLKPSDKDPFSLKKIIKKKIDDA